MITDSDITITQGDTRVVPIPVEDADTSSDYIDPANATAIRYVITPQRGGGTAELDVNDTDDPGVVDVVVAEDVIDPAVEKPTDLSDVPDGTNVVRVTLDSTTTAGLPEGRLYHECELSGIRDSVATIMQGEVRVISSST